MTGVPGASPVVAAVVLGVVLLAGVLTGRARRRWTLLLAGLMGMLVLALAITGIAGPAIGDRASAVTALYSVALPLVMAFGAGWLCGRATWTRRLVVLAAAVLVLAFFPYTAAGSVTADMLSGPESPVPVGAGPG